MRCIRGVWAELTLERVLGVCAELGLQREADSLVGGRRLVRRRGGDGPEVAVALSTGPATRSIEQKLGSVMKRASEYTCQRKTDIDAKAHGGLCFIEWPFH